MLLCAEAIAAFLNSIFMEAIGSARARKLEMERLDPVPPQATLHSVYGPDGGVPQH
jgi:hypothetical protein